MDKKIMKKWVKALRSGKYRKTTDQLCRVAQNGNKSYCCLGVLTELYLKENKNRDVQADLENPLCKTLPEEVMDWAGMATNGGALVYNKKKTDLTCLNDSTRAKRSFKRIADIVEKNWEQL